MLNCPMTLPGINIRAPWAQAIISGRKVIETRFYPMPAKWIGQPLVIIETPGTTGRFTRRIAGLVIFDQSWCYADKIAFARDQAKHLVDPDDPVFGWRDDSKPKWAWPIQWVIPYQQPLPPGLRAGIRYARAVEILEPPAALGYRACRKDKTAKTSTEVRLNRDTFRMPCEARQRTPGRIRRF